MKRFCVNLKLILLIIGSAIHRGDEVMYLSVDHDTKPEGRVS
jgi:hypothetical protein